MRLVIDIFDYHAAYKQRQYQKAFISKSAIGGYDRASLDTYTGLPYELEQEITDKYQSLKEPLRLPSSLWDDLSVDRFPVAPSSLSSCLSQKALNANAAVFTPGSSALAPLSPILSRKQLISETIQPVFSPLRTLDWRFGLIQVDYYKTPLQRESAAMPLSPMSLTGSLELPPIFERRGRSNTDLSESTFSTESPSPAREGDAGTIDLGYGIVHLYKDEEEAKKDEDAEETTALQCRETHASILDGTMVAILGVPANWAVSDLLEFIAESVEPIEQMRTMKDALPNRYMVLIKFKTARDATQFQQSFEGRPYSEMLIDEICHVVRISAVEIRSSGSAPYTFAFPQRGPEFGFTKDACKKKEQGMMELPTCPVCLERLDSNVSGLITVQCSHTFHCLCLKGWHNNNCPVCRYSQGKHKADKHLGGALPDSCAVCAARDSLWMCLICGHIGCGRFSGRHAHAHFEETGHTFAYELESQRVWDYAGDQYVHRLIQSKTDGKLVELPSNAAAGSMTKKPGPHGSAGDEIAKIEAISIEFSHLLSSQLDSQRSYYAEKVVKLKTDLVRAEGKNESARLESKKLNDKLAAARRDTEETEMKRREREDTLLEKIRILEEQVVPGLERDRARIEQKLEKATDLARSLHKDLDSERSVTRGLLSNITKLKDENEKRKNETDHLQSQIKDLNEQLQDLMFTLSAQVQLAQGEGAGGDVIIKQQASPPSKSASLKKKKKK